VEAVRAGAAGHPAGGLGPLYLHSLPAVRQPIGPASLCQE
jgi:hypothetical protein